MAVAFDAFSISGTTTGNIVWTHTPSGTPRGIAVAVVNLNGENPSTAATYGGTGMAKVSGAPNIKATGEVGAVDVWFLGANVPTGAQTISVTVNGAGTKVGRGYSVTADWDTTITDADGTINSDSQTDPSVTLGLSGFPSWAMIAFLSGHDDVSGVAPLTDWTADQEADAGTRVAGFYHYDIVAGDDVTAGWTQTAEDAIAIALAVREVVIYPPHYRTRLRALGRI